MCMEGSASSMAEQVLQRHKRRTVKPLQAVLGASSEQTRTMLWLPLWRFLLGAVWARLSPSYSTYLFLTREGCPRYPAYVPYPAKQAERGCRRRSHGQTTYPTVLRYRRLSGALVGCSGAVAAGRSTVKCVEGCK